MRYLRLKLAKGWLFPIHNYGELLELYGGELHFDHHRNGPFAVVEVEILQWDLELVEVRVECVRYTGAVWRENSCPEYGEFACLII